MTMWSQARQIFATKKLPFSSSLFFFFFSFFYSCARNRKGKREKEKMDGRNEERRKGSELEMDSNHDRLTSPFLSPDSHSFNLFLFFFLSSTFSLSLSSTSTLSLSLLLSFFLLPLFFFLFPKPIHLVSIRSLVIHWSLHSIGILCNLSFR